MFSRVLKLRSDQVQRLLCCFFVPFSLNTLLRLFGISIFNAWLRLVIFALYSTLRFPLGSGGFYYTVSLFVVPVE